MIGNVFDGYSSGNFFERRWFNLKYFVKVISQLFGII
jgi:hypothetical protein